MGSPRSLTWALLGSGLVLVACGDDEATQDGSGGTGATVATGASAGHGGQVGAGGQAGAPVGPPECGNGVLEPGEACDGEALGGYGCESIAAGFVSGTLGCAAGCLAFDTAACERGATIVAASCAQADVQAAIDQAADGDWVAIPAGECSWAAKVEFCKSIVVQGAGVGSTVITDDTPSTSTAWTETPFWIEGCTGASLRLTGLSLRDTGTEDPAGMITVWAENTRFRFDHLELLDTVSRGFWIEGTGSFGVIDHCEITKTTPIHAQDIIVNGGDADGSWALPMSYGTERAVFIEDSVFDHAGPPDMTVDCTNGGRYVFRNNEVRNSKIGNHGLDSVMRSCLQMEIYDNAFTSDFADGVYMGAINSRGGSAVVFGNEISGLFGLPIAVTNYRSCCYAGAACTPGSEPDWGTCDGTNPIDGNVEPVATNKGWPCRDQIGRGTDQSAQAFYEWDNRFDGEDADVTVFNTWDGCDDPQPSDHVKPERDYFDDTPRPDYRPYPHPHPLAVIE